MKNYLILSIVFLFLLACNADKTNKNNTSKNEKLPKKKTFLEAKLTESSKKLAISNNQFAFDFYKQMKEKSDENITFSPISLYAVLGISYFNPQQKKAIPSLEKIMYLDKNKNLAQDFYDMQGSIINANPATDINISNSLWLKNTNNIDKEYEKTIKKYFETDIKKIENAEIINNWVAQQTRNKITQIIDELTLKSLIHILINATYFKGKWESPFDKEYTKDEDFTLLNNTKIKVKMMQKTSEFCQFYEDNNLKMIQMPYQKNDFSMYFILPNNNQSFQNVENNLNFATFQDWDKKLTGENLKRIFIPRFKFDDLPLINCLSLLKKLGLNNFVTHAIYQKVFIEVNEEGTEAAAVTYEETKEEAPPPPPKIKEFVANRPFFFILKNNKTGAILFMGRVLSPQNENKYRDAD